jgi:hypothetical protein
MASTWLIGNGHRSRNGDENQAVGHPRANGADDSPGRFG